MAHEQTPLLGDTEAQAPNKLTLTKILAGVVGM